MHINQRKKLSAARETAFIALTCALMTGVQFALSAVPGVEFVTVILLCTSYVFGARFGCLTGLAFSLLRCLLFGFYPAVVAVYCIYFPLFGLLFGTIGRGDDGGGLTFKLKICVNLVLAALSAAAVVAAALELVKVSRIYRDAVYAMLWALGGIFVALAISFDAVWLASRKKSGGERALRCFFVTALAALCTVAFTLIDDVVSPLILGLTQRGALAYFYASYTAMLPQTICTVFSVGLLFTPLTHALKRAL